MQIRFVPSQLLWEGELTLFAITHSGIRTYIQALGSVEGAWLPFYARGGTQNVSEAASPSKPPCREEGRLPALPKTQFSSLRRLVPGAVGGAGGHEVSALPRWRRRRRPGPARRGSRPAPPSGSKANRASALRPWPVRPRLGRGAEERVVERGRNVPRLASNAGGKYCSARPLLALSLPFRAPLRSSGPGARYLYSKLWLLSRYGRKKLHDPKLFLSLLEY